MRTNIVIDDDLMEKALEVSGCKTKKDVVELALRELIIANSRMDLSDLKGKITFAEGYDYKTLREGR
ncbi:MAG: type II toxin-antitoxin system VapB family antitoxin [Defluviitaleaceae bacterium]|nr:type II toxin-antitoxin system VapB family antitoxin [Defluviitaleaceae bacterium]